MADVGKVATFQGLGEFVGKKDHPITRWPAFFAWKLCFSGQYFSIYIKIVVLTPRFLMRLDHDPCRQFACRQALPCLLQPFAPDIS